MFMSDLTHSVTATANTGTMTRPNTIIEQMAAAQALNVLKRRLSDDQFAVGTPCKMGRTQQQVSVVSSPVSVVGSPVPKRSAVFTYLFDNQFI